MNDAMIVLMSVGLGLLALLNALVVLLIYMWRVFLREVHNVKVPKPPRRPVRIIALQEQEDE